MELPYIIGQIFGVIATVASIIMPLFQKKWQMLVNTAVVNICMALNFVLIGEIGSAVFLCVVATVQCGVSLVHTLRETRTTNIETAIFFLLYIGFGFFGLVSAPGFVWAVNAKNLLELLPILGSIMSMTFVFVRDEHKARWFLLATGSIWSVYTAIVGSSAFFAQIFLVITTLAAMFKYRGTKAEA